MKKKLYGLLVFMLCCIGMVAVGGCDVSAITMTWTGAGGDGLASTVANWSPAGVPQAGDDLIVSGDVNFDLGPVAISSVTMTDCSGIVTGSLVIASSLSSTGCDPVFANLPSLYASVTLAGSATINGWILGQAGNIYTIDMGGFDLAITNVMSGSIPFGQTSTRIVGTGTMTIGRVTPPSGLVANIATNELHVDSMNGIDYSGFSGTMEVVGATSINVDYAPSALATINIRQGGLLGFVNFVDSIGATVNAAVNVYSNRSMIFLGEVKVPNVILYQNTALIFLEGLPFPSTNPRVDLTGINLNGFCIDYGLVEVVQSIIVASWSDGSSHFIGADMTGCPRVPSVGLGGSEGSETGVLGWELGLALCLTLGAGLLAVRKLKAI